MSSPDRDASERVEIATGAAISGAAAETASPPIGGAGTRAGVAMAVRDAGPLLPLRDAEQLELLRDDGGRLDVVQAKRAPRGVGRPAGARNQRTQEVRDYLLGRYAHPLEVLAQIISRPIDAIVAETGCRPIEALALVKSAAAELAPYVEGKMPVAVDLNIYREIPTLVIEGVTHASEELADLLDGEFMTVEEGEAEMAENRQFPEAE
ncbi:hypothetical protein [Sphingomonas oligoaromativorans]|uniref:hypothetical protein n=1 Tax=Sphingomonas oligoaromativorans TaxID=575322 RepID=UPI001420D402|nr:hypothetical protein [Sphingomonas oligoaromativorans]NIJ34327.1 hypothetical protein [Sphingomonas oligoaromativorans]